MRNTEEMVDVAAVVLEALTYYRQTVTESVLGLWVESLKGYDAAQVSEAVRRHIKSPDRGNFPVTISDVVRQLEGTTGDRAALAWGKVFEAMKGIGAYTDVCFDEAAIHAAIEDIGGWPKLCRTELDEIQFVQKRFCDSFRAYASQKDFSYPRRLHGDRSPDDDYVAKGLKAPAPVPVGDIAKCRDVFAGGAAHGRLANMVAGALSDGRGKLQ